MENQKRKSTWSTILKVIIAVATAIGSVYNPQIEMFARFKMKSSFHKTKRII